MYIVPEEDIKMFAQGLKGRHGPMAHYFARERAKELSALGDAEGENAWSRVADVLQPAEPA